MEKTLTLKIFGIKLPKYLTNKPLIPKNIGSQNNAGKNGLISLILKLTSKYNFKRKIWS